MTYMLDTNICIYAMKNKPEHVLQRLKKELNSGICISSITLRNTARSDPIYRIEVRRLAH